MQSNALLMRLPLHGRCFSPMPPAVSAKTSEPVMGHGDFSGNASTALFPPTRNHFNKPMDVSLT